MRHVAKDAIKAKLEASSAERFAIKGAAWILGSVHARYLPSLRSPKNVTFEFDGVLTFSLSSYGSLHAHNGEANCNLENLALQGTWFFPTSEKCHIFDGPMFT
jgi:hypothetical protein